MKKIIIVGAGLGGLAAGVLLQVRGFDVTILEKNGHVGGKMMPMKLGEYSFDFGPNTITMPHVFQQVFKEAGENPDDYMPLMKLNNHTKNWFNDGSTFMMTTNRNKMIHQLEQIDSKGAKNYEQYLESVKKLYTIAQDQFFYRTFSSWKDYMNPSLFTSLLKVKPFETIDSFHRRFFDNENVINAFNRYATYIGSSPYVSPATFSLIGHLEMNEGVYYVKGGNPRIAEGFAEVFQKAGGTLILNEAVEKVQVENKKAVGVELESGEKLPADSVIVNGDLLQAYPSLVDEEDRPHFTNKIVSKFEPSISAYVILAGTKNRNDSLIHHQVYFSDDYKNEFYELFKKKQLPSDPTIYICNSSYTDKNVAPGDNLFILVNAPAGVTNDDGYEQVIYEKLKRFGVDITSTLACEKIINPRWIEKQFGAYKGALYGISANRKVDSFLRPSNVSKDVRSLYFVGGTTHPGGGSPMVTISGINMANLIST
ncbi:phytoene desaturase family protein [Priestia flexa]|uniref:phytoene desaturase family protein n=1 Tax=Priestia flexa TaxID=86664 RepID=UPI001B34390C|nr:phytoene desaturase family protein [Priestia flexa]